MIRNSDVKVLNMKEKMHKDFSVWSALRRIGFLLVAGSLIGLCYLETVPDPGWKLLLPVACATAGSIVLFFSNPKKLEGVC